MPTRCCPHDSVFHRAKNPGFSASNLPIHDSFSGGRPQTPPILCTIIATSVSTVLGGLPKAHCPHRPMRSHFIISNQCVLTPTGSGVACCYISIHQFGLFVSIFHLRPSIYPLASAEPQQGESEVTGFPPPRGGQ